MIRLLILALASACIGLPAIAASAERPPNLVVVFTDDQGYQDVGCFGSPDIRTPRLDAMAKDGMKFTSFYAQPICGPSRAAIMTGCYPMRVAERGNVKQVHPILHSDEITVAEVLKTKGYATACFGKWDLAKHAQAGFFMDLFPTRQGFDYFFGTPTSNDGVANLYRDEKLIEPKSNMATLTKRYTDEAIGFMRKHKDRPFFVYIPHTMPHTRLDASPPFKGKSKRGLYGDVIEEIDHNVGRILDAIREMGLEKNTYVLFTSDNGPWLIKNKDLADGHLPRDHGGSAGPLRSGKVSTFEGGVRVPTILWGPGRVPAGTTCDKIAGTLDILPTFAALAGAEAPKDRVIDGEDIRHLFHGQFEKANPDKAFFYYLRVHLQAVRQGKWKLHLPRDKQPEGAAPFSVNRHIAPADRVGFDTPFLVDLENDPGETTNVSDGNPEVVKRLLALVEAMREDLGDYDRVGRNMRFFDPVDPRPTKPPVPAPRKPKTRKKAARGLAVPVRAAAPDSPNVLFISVDDLNDWVGCLGGHPQAKTPNLDRLAASGTLFSNAYCPAASCNPSRSAILSGVPPHRSGLYRNEQKMRKVLPDAELLPKYFSRHGYTSAGSGKILHYFIDAPSWDDYFPAKEKENPFPRTFYPKQRPVGLPYEKWMYVECDWAALDRTLDQYGGDYLVAEWIGKQLLRDRDKPFFLACGIYRPHLPWFVPKEYYDRFPLDTIQLPPGVKADDLADVPEEGRRLAADRYHPHIRKHGKWREGVQGYLASIAFADDMVGRVLDALDKSRHRDDTIVVLWSDHGWHLGEKRHWRKFTGWRVCDRVPLMIRVPKGVPGLAKGTKPGSVCSRPVNLVDLFKTLNALCGLPPKNGIGGNSLVPLLEDPQAAWVHPSVTCFGGPERYAVSTERWRYIHYINGGEEMYDIVADPYEWTNRVGDPQHQAQLAKMRSLAPPDRRPAVREPPPTQQSQAFRKTAPAIVQAPVDFNHPAREYVPRKLSGWSVLVEKQLLDESPDLAQAALDRLARKLGEAVVALPQTALSDLRKLRIFLMYGSRAKAGGRDNGLEYFRADAPKYHDWLDPRMGSSIVVFNAANYVQISEQWALKALVHELGHAQHLEHWPEDRADIFETWEHAMKAGLFQKVHPDDKKAHFPNYAAQNHLEYFAELTAMYFAGANYWPRNREGLKAYDADGYALVEKLWGIRHAQP